MIKQLPIKLIHALLRGLGIVSIGVFKVFIFID
jgi:hypothetical protein